METMQWSEVSTTSSSPTSAGNDQTGIGLGVTGSDTGGSPGAPPAPTIKNHSVTYFNDHLYCFGGYDGRRNHNLLLLYSIREHRWIRPHTLEDEYGSERNSSGTGNNGASSGTPGRVSEAAASGTNNNNRSRSRSTSRSRGISFEVDGDGDGDEDEEGDRDIRGDETSAEWRGNDRGNAGNNDSNDGESEPSDPSQEHHVPHLQQQQQQRQQQQPQQQQQQQPQPVAISHNQPYNNNHSPHNSRRVGSYPGIGAVPSHDESRYAYTVTGSPPPGRNGHSATLATDEDDDNDSEDIANGEQRGENVTGRIIILGGWLGQGPLAASDMHVLEIARGGKRLRWYQPAVKGTPPGPCNMHSADYVKARKEVFVFRGGNGREYLNDVHALHVPTMTWRKVATTGESPQQRANHSSCILEETGEIFIFGGWNGTNRLNDIHIFDTKTCNWSCPKVGGVLPHPRAGMTLTALRGRLYLFGGSGTSSKCFQDLQILDREEMAWLDVTQYETFSHGNTNNNSNSDHHHNQMHPPHYHRQHHFALPPSQHYYMHSHSHQHQHYQHQHQHHHHHPFANYQDNGWSNPQWNFGGQQYYDYNGGGHHHHQYNTANNRSLSNHGSVTGTGTYAGTGVPYNYQQMTNNDNESNTEDHHRPGSFTSSRADWTSRELAARPRSMGTGVIASPNPNDEDTSPTVVLHGLRIPGSRAGHTATAVNRKIYVFGGSCGSDYLNDFYVLDTDPPPRATVTEPASSHLIKRRLPHFFNDEEFSDVTFLVQGRRVYGHKMVLAIVSDCFRAMFTAGFRESSSSEIEITGCTYDAFLAVMEYVYIGVTPTVPSQMTGGPEDSRRRLDKIVDILELADRFFLDHFKQVCESQLQSNVRADTVEYLLQIAQKTNAMQLQAICEHFMRNRDSE